MPEQACLHRDSSSTARQAGQHRIRATQDSAKKNEWKWAESAYASGTNREFFDPEGFRCSTRRPPVIGHLCAHSSPASTDAQNSRPSHAQSQRVTNSHHQSPQRNPSARRGQIWPKVGKHGKLLKNKHQKNELEADKKNKKSAKVEKKSSFQL